MTRALPKQRPPDPARVTASFPEISGRRGVMFRAGGVDDYGQPRSPGWFASDGGGRFDLTPDARPTRVVDPRGTLYVARSPHSAVMEKVGEIFAEAPAVTEDVAEQIYIWRLYPLVSLRLADLDADEADQLGVTGELSAGSDYPVYQLWAARFDELAFEGISYHPRFSSSKRVTATAWAVFGDAGAHLGPFRQIRGVPERLVNVSHRIGVAVQARAATRPPPVTTDDLLD